MYELTGRIVEVVKISDRVSKIVIQKQVSGKKTAIAVEVFGLWKTKVDELRLQKNEKIVGKLFLKSNIYNGKWYTDCYFKEVKRWVPKPKYNPDEYNQTKKTPEHELFFGASENDLDTFNYDPETGEIK
jgi:hypothetical protein